MPDTPKLNQPWLIAVWPGMGNVAISAGYYLMAKLGMHLLADFSSKELFDIEHVEVKGGIIRNARLPRSRFFVWSERNRTNDIVIFIGEAQPPIGKYAFCRRLIEFAQELDVSRVFTFAAMATQMHPSERARVFGAATEMESLEELKLQDLEILEDGHIGGLNGVLLGAAAEAGMRGACLLGEMPHIFAQLPFPKASLAVLNVFTEMANLNIDFSELTEQADAMDQKLGELLESVQAAVEPHLHEEEEHAVETTDEEGLSPQDERRIEDLFAQAKRDRSKAYELKRELDRLEVFKEFEDRFLDLFKKPD